MQREQRRGQRQARPAIPLGAERECLTRGRLHQVIVGDASRLAGALQEQRGETGAVRRAERILHGAPLEEGDVFGAARLSRCSPMSPTS
jgi:hypothetical protein